MAETISQHQQGAFTVPVNATTIDATEVLGNDNTLRVTTNAHDSDADIHLQSSTLAARPAASDAGRKWLTTDGLRIYYDTGSAWSEIGYAVLAVNNTFTTGQTIAAGASSPGLLVTTTDTTIGQLRLRYDTTNLVSLRVGSTGQFIVTTAGGSDQGLTLLGSGTSRFDYSGLNGGTGTAIFTSTSIVCSAAALATTATAGFLYVPTCAGAPTGTPTAQTGTVALVFDTTNNKFYIYDAGWIGVVLS